MFLPVLLVRDYGIWGFVVFAVPNVIGAGAMGWVLTSQESSRRTVQAHAFALRAFSVVTIGFQAFFLGWIPTQIHESSGNDAGTRIAQAILIVAAFFAIRLFVRRAGHALVARSALAVLGISLACAAGLILLRVGDYWSDVKFRPLMVSDHSGVVWLAPACAFGFALCPYLDLTFHRARMNTSRAEAARVFSIGFGIMFLSMILLTLLIAPLGLGLMGWPIWYAVPFVAGVLLAIHWIVQSTFTVFVHSLELPDAAHPSGPRVMGLTISIALLAGLVGATVPRTLYADLLAGEIIYRLFMSFYGLLFPAYVWLCMIPARGERITQKPTQHKLIVFAAACLLAAPCYWMGFIERETIWLAPGLGVVLIARLFIKRSSAQATFPRPEGGG